MTQDQQVQGGIGFTAGVAPDGVAFVQIDFVQGTFRFTFVVPADQASKMAGEFADGLRKAAKDAQRASTGLVVASEVPHINGRH